MPNIKTGKTRRGSKNSLVNNQASTHNLFRIICYLESTEKATKNELGLIIDDRSKVNSALAFLLRVKIITKRHVPKTKEMKKRFGRWATTSFIYELNPEWRKIWMKR